MKKIVLITSLLTLANTLFAGVCNQAKNTVDPHHFMIANSLNQSISVSQYRTGSFAPIATSSIGSKGTLQGSNKRVIQICAHTTNNITKRVTQTSKVACCSAHEGFLGSTVTFSGNNSQRGYSASSDTHLIGKSFGYVSGH